MHWWALSVLSIWSVLSVCPVHDPKSRAEGHRKMKIGRKEAHDSGDPWPHLEVESSKGQRLRSPARLGLVTTRPKIPNQQSAISLEQESLLTSNLVYGWSTTCAVTSKLKCSWVAVRVSTCRGRGHVAVPLQATQLVKACLLIVLLLLSFLCDKYTVIKNASLLGHFYFCNIFSFCHLFE